MPAHRLIPTTLLIILILLGGAAASAEETAIVHRLTLQQAIAMARASSPRLAEAAAVIRASDAVELLARAGRQPNIGVSASYSHLSDVPEYAPFPGQVIFPNIPRRYSVRLGLTVPVFDGGRVRWGITAAEGQRAAAGQDLGTAQANLRLEVTSAYLQVLLARAKEEVLAAAIAAFAAHLKDVENRISFGLAASDELLAVRVERDRAELARIRATGGRAVATANLARLLGLAPDAAIETVEQLTTVPAPPGDPGQLVATAQARRPELAAAVARVGAARAVLELARAELRPQVNAAAGFSYARPNLQMLPPKDRFDDSWDIGLSLSYRFYDGGRRRAAVQRAEAEVAAAGHRMEELKRAISLDVMARYHELLTSRAAIPVAASGLEAAEENLRVSRDRFREGLIPSSRLLDAEVVLLRAGLDHTSALTETHLAGARLERAVAP